MTSRVRSEDTATQETGQPWLRCGGRAGSGRGAPESAGGASAAELDGPVAGSPAAASRGPAAAEAAAAHVEVAAGAVSQDLPPSASVQASLATGSQLHVCARHAFLPARPLSLQPSGHAARLHLHPSSRCGTLFSSDVSRHLATWWA